MCRHTFLAGRSVAVVIKAGLDPLADLAVFLEPFGSLVRRAQSRHALERYTTGLLADLRRKTASDLGRAVSGTNGQRLQEFLTRTAWDSEDLDRLRVQQMVAQASGSLGVQIIDDTGFAKKGAHSVGVARQYSGTLGRVDPSGEGPSGGDFPLFGPELGLAHRRPGVPAGKLDSERCST